MQCEESKICIKKKGKLIKLDLPTIVSSVSGQFGQPASVISGNQNNQTL